MNAKSLPSGYVELKSLIADLKCFRLEEYALKLQDKKKLQQIYTELHSYYGKKFAQAMRPDEEMRLINKLWESLDLALQERETLLEQAILRSEKLQTKYKDFTSVIEKLDISFDILKTQLSSLMDQYSCQKISRVEMLGQLDKLEAQIRQKENDIRRTSIRAHSLEEEDYSNAQIFIEQLKRLEQVTIQLVCSINTARNPPVLASTTTTTTTTVTSKTTSFSKIITEAKKQQQQQLHSMPISPPNSVVGDQGSSSNFSTPSQSITTNSSSSHRSSAHFKSATNYYELTSVLTTPPPLLSSDSAYSPKSTATTASESFLSNISMNLSKSISLLNKSGLEANNLSSVSDVDIIDVVSDSFNWIRLKQAEVNEIEIRPDLAQIQLGLDFLLRLKTELTQSKTSLETIELLKLNHSETPELTQLVNQLNKEYHGLCATAKRVKEHLDSLGEFIRLVHEELQYVNEMEDGELNRDWSQPGRLNEDELLAHRKEVETSLGSRKIAYARIMALAESLIEAKHPASDDIKVSV